MNDINFHWSVYLIVGFVLGWFAWDIKKIIRLLERIAEDVSQ